MVLSEEDSRSQPTKPVYPFTVLMYNGKNCLTMKRDDGNSSNGHDSLAAQKFCQHVTGKVTDTCTRLTCPLLALNAAVPKHQVAGHMFGAKKFGILQSPSGESLLKPIQSGQRGLRELEFYRRVFSSDASFAQSFGHPEFNLGTEQSEDLADLRNFLPKYKGYICTPNVCFMELEDVTFGSECPCLVDAKIGARTWDPLADVSKIEREKRKFAPLAQVGYQLLGMRTFLADSGEHYWSKTVCRQMSAENLVWKCWSLYFGSDRDGVGGRLRKAVIKQVLEQTEEIRSFAARQTTYQFFATSLLIYYDAKKFVDASVDFDIENVAADRVRVCLIDFAHVFPSQQNEIDQNFLNGLDGVIRDLKLLLTG